MRFTEQQQKGWLYTCTVDQRLAVFGVMHDWALHVVDCAWGLDPLESRREYRVWASELANLAREEHGVELSADQGLLKQWHQLGPSTQARWVAMTGGWFDDYSPGQDAAWVIRHSLDPPSFRSQTSNQQSHLLAQIAGEIERYFSEDPHWYGKPDSRVYQQLADSIGALNRPVDWEVPSPVLWSHVAGPQRGRILADIAKCAAADSHRPRLEEDARYHLTQLARAADWIADLHRDKVLIRE